MYLKVSRRDAELDKAVHTPSAYRADTPTTSNMHCASQTCTEGWASHAGRLHPGCLRGGKKEVKF